MTPTRSFLITTAPGLEPVVRKELDDLGVDANATDAGLTTKLPLADGAALAARLRTAAHVLLRVADGRVANLDELARLVRTTQWGELLDPRARVDVDAVLHGRLAGRRDIVAKKVENALKDALRGKPRALKEWPKLEQRLLVRVDGDTVQLSLEVGGEPLYKRGWRPAGGMAPLREHIAASMLVAAGYDGDEPLVDPMCGSGTIVIEAARIAAGLPPGTRRYAYEEWPALATARPRPPTPSGASPFLLGADRDEAPLGHAKENAGRARVRVAWLHTDVDALELPAGPGLIATNPPWGGRLGGDVEGAYHRLARLLERSPGWRMIFLCPDASRARLVSKRATRLTSFRAGTIEVGMWAIDR